MKNKHMIIPIFIPHKGCPHDCFFCNQKRISGQKDEMTLEIFHRSVKEHLKTINTHDKAEIAFFGGSFTGIPMNEQNQYLDAAGEYILEGRIDSIRLSTRPDYINERILENLKEKNVAVIELGAQSMDDEVLRASNRGHVREDTIKASELIRKYGFKLGIQTMIGLPGDNKEKAAKTALDVVQMKPDMVRIYPTLVIRDTYLEDMFQLGDYVPLTVEDAVDWCVEIMDIYDEAEINVIRVGLQTTEEINPNAHVTAGPFHPAFRQLVDSMRWRKYLEKEILSYDRVEDRELLIYCKREDISNIIGHGKSNIMYLKQKYKLKEILTVPTSERTQMKIN